MIEEIWKDVIGYEGIYQVSNLGNIKSKSRNGTKNNYEWLYIKQNLKKSGYLNVVLTKNNNSKTFRTHRLVAIAFLLNKENKPQVNHKNGIRNDNCIDNLEWVTASENKKHSIYVLEAKNSFLGKTHSEESKQKMREYRLGKSGSGCNHFYIIINNIEYKGIRIACKELGINRSSLVRKLKNSISTFVSNGVNCTINSIKV